MRKGIKELLDMFEYWGVTQGDHKALLNFLITNKNELNEFMDEYYTGNIILDMVNYQRFKRYHNQLAFDEFEELFKQNKKEALEKIFQEPIMDHQLEYMTRYDVTCKELYRRLKENSNESYLMLVKKRHYDMPIIVNDDILLTT